MKRKILSLLLLSFFLSLIMPYKIMAQNSIEEKGMEINKSATYNAEDGSYTIKLEAYATGSKIITEVTKDVPTDIIIVIDQSGSMADDIGTVSFEKYENSNDYFGTIYRTRNKDYYENRHNGGNENLWHKLPDGAYVSVSVNKEEKINYIELNNLKNYETNRGQLTQNCYYYYANNLYEKIGDDYHKVSVTRSGNWREYTYTYTFEDGTAITSRGNNSVPDLGSHAPLYGGNINQNETEYIYSYKDKDEVVIIGTSTGDDTISSLTFYKRIVSTSGGGSKLQAIKNAVSSFADTVALKAKGKDGDITTAEDNIDHRIAIVGFASSDYWDYNQTYYNYNNSEVFIGNKQYTYGEEAKAQYKNAFQDMSNDKGINNINDSINSLDADGGTFINHGIEMAAGIFKENPIQEDSLRNRVVIVFTDGVPGWNGYEQDVANDAINKANILKNDYKATVYTIGIFSGADATSAGDINGNDTEKANYFMHQVSSNNGNVKTPSYYLSAGDTEALNNIFKQISSQIESGGTSSTLNEEAIIKDIISPQFKLPDNATEDSITIETYSCIGKNGDEYLWANNNDTMGAKALIDGNEVRVTGFDFSKNHVGTLNKNGAISYYGSKLVISFKVYPSDDFIGGNDVYTNVFAGIYSDKYAEKPLLTFNKPTVNVPIKDISVKAKEKNIYLLNDLDLNELLNDSEIKIGNVSLYPNKANYGLEKWQNEYVDIKINVKDRNGKLIKDKLEKVTNDSKYSIEVVVTPKTSGNNQDDALTSKTSTSALSDINVFKPELTFKDSYVYYGDISSDEDYKNNLVNERWFHNDSYSTDENIVMVGIKPELDIEYFFNISLNGKYYKDDYFVYINTKIKNQIINDYTKLVHIDCDPSCYWQEVADYQDLAFLLHVKTCSLTINKTGGKDNEPYVFDIYKDDKLYSKVTIVGNNSETIHELPTGTYRIEEDTTFSWRYLSDSGKEVDLNKDKPYASITCKNTLINNKWLNGYSKVIRNIPGIERL